MLALLAFAAVVAASVALWWFAFRGPATKPERPEEPKPAAPATAVPGLRYWLEPKGSGAHLSGAAPLAQGTGFRLHFEVPSSGRLYLVGPDDKQQLRALVAGPAAPRLASDAPFVFPSGKDWIFPTAGTEVDRVIVVFAPDNAPPIPALDHAPGEPLSADDARALSAFIDAHAPLRRAASDDATEVVPASSDAPLAFELVISYGPKGGQP
jgi:hypothetical protein